MRILSWLLRAFIFFTLFAFALNNQHTASVHWFFGVEWRAPMVFVVLASFAAGCALVATALLPGWLKSRRSGLDPGLNGSAAQKAAGKATDPADAAAGKTSPTATSDFGGDHPSRLGI